MQTKHAALLIRLARLAILARFDARWQELLSHVEAKAKIISELNQHNGIFVTLNEWPSGKLRGCIGFVHSNLPLWQTVQQAALAAAFNDPRFVPLTQEELDNITIEISVLSQPEIIKTADEAIQTEKQEKALLKKIEIGKHGLIIESGFYSGLLLPQVATEYKWDSKQFVQQTCWKAGLNKDCWKQQGVVIYRFSAEVFTETKPRGEVKKENN